MYGGRSGGGIRDHPALLPIPLAEGLDLLLSLNYTDVLTICCSHSPCSELVGMMRYFPTKVHFCRSWRKLSPAAPRSPRMLIASHIKTWIKTIRTSFTGVSQEPFLCSKLYSFANFVTRYSIINWPKVKGGEWESITFNNHTNDSTRGVLSFRRLLLPLIASSPNLYPLPDST